MPIMSFPNLPLLPLRTGTIFHEAASICIHKICIRPGMAKQVWGECKGLSQTLSHRESSLQYKELFLTPKESEWKVEHTVIAIF